MSASQHFLWSYLSQRLPWVFWLPPISLPWAQWTRTCCRYCSCIQKPAYFSELQQYLAVLGWSRDLEPVVNKAIKGLKPLLEDKLARKKDQPSLLHSAIGCMFKKNNSYLIKYLSNNCNRQPCYIIHSNSYNGVSQQIELLLAMTAVCCHCACIAVCTSLCMQYCLYCSSKVMSPYTL